jgi:hypothetical protein
MPDIIQSLQGKDLQFLHGVADTWGIELEAQDLRSAIQLLAHEMDQKALFDEVLDAFDDNSKTAILELHAADGKVPWASFTRKYGEIRGMGAAKRERERPDRNPANASETLWYSGILGKAFFKLQKEPLEYAYIADEIMAFISQKDGISTGGLADSRPASSLEKQVTEPVNDSILDHMTTLLAAIRTGQPLENIPWRNQVIPVSFLIHLAQCAHLIDEENHILPNQVRSFMEARRGEALMMLVQAWKNGPFNDLHELPGLIFEGQWQNPAQETRQYVVDELHKIPAHTWWSLASFVESIHQNNPDFQRPAGDYDSWYIRRQNSESYLRGVRTWNEIDGALIRQMICGHMHWLGIMETASLEKGQAPTAFRFSAWADALLAGATAPVLSAESESIKIRSDGTIHISRQASRAVRYQVARFCHMIQEEPAYYQYQIQSDSLTAASKAGLKVEQFASLLQKAGEKPIPPIVFTLLENWKSHGVQAHIAPVMLLSVEDAAILDALLNSRASKYMGERLNPCTILVNEKQIKLVISILAELGYLSNVQANSVVKIRKG